MDYGKCSACGAALERDEWALNMKSVSPEREKHLCLDCLAEKYGRPRESFERAIENFRMLGCTLF